MPPILSPAKTGTRPNQTDIFAAVRDKLTIPKTTLGRTIFWDPLNGTHNVSEIRFQLEIKALACAFTGGFNGFTPRLDRIRNKPFQSLIGFALSLKEPRALDLTLVKNHLADAASLALVAIMDDPHWGPHDLTLLQAIEMIELCQRLAHEGGITL
jgi:hypothetical protein